MAIGQQKYTNSEINSLLLAFCQHKTWRVIGRRVSGDAAPAVSAMGREVLDGSSWDDAGRSEGRIWRACKGGRGSCEAEDDDDGSRGEGWGSSGGGALSGRMSGRMSFALIVASACGMIFLLSAVTLTEHRNRAAILLKAKSTNEVGEKNDLSLFANSAPSYYMPGDTATDADILPRLLPPPFFAFPSSSPCHPARQLSFFPSPPTKSLLPSPLQPLLYLSPPLCHEQHPNPKNQPVSTTSKPCSLHPETSNRLHESVLCLHETSTSRNQQRNSTPVTNNDKNDKPLNPESKNPKLAKPTRQERVGRRWLPQRPRGSHAQAKVPRLHEVIHQTLNPKP
jgi:hypothetical protein